MGTWCDSRAKTTTITVGSPLPSIKYSIHCQPTQIPNWNSVQYLEKTRMTQVSHGTMMRREGTDFTLPFSQCRCSRSNHRSIRKLSFTGVSDFCLDGLSTLCFPEMNHRRQEIPKVSSGTCTWIFEDQTYQDWTNGEREILWIKGKPGSGKSTIMRRIIEKSVRQKARRQTQISYFFHRRGSELQYSQLGMFRAILYQLLSQVSCIRTSFGAAWVHKKREHGGMAYAVDWRVEELRDLFSSLLLEAAEEHDIKIFVDALDEAGEEAAKELISFFYGLSDDVRESRGCVSICFSCRRYPVLPTYNGLEIWVDQKNKSDIERYIAIELQKQLIKDVGHQTAVETLQVEFAKRASGVFLWIALMIPAVAKWYNEGYSLQSLVEYLDEGPADLSYIYEHILREVVDPENRPQTLLLMRLVFLAETPISGLALHHALTVDHDSIRSSNYSAEELKNLVGDESKVERSILSLSGGLVEIIPDPTDRHKSYAQFVHETVNDFLREDSFRCLGFRPGCRRNAESHMLLGGFCLDYAKLAFEMVSSPVFSDVYERFPFIIYATSNWFIHLWQSESIWHWDPVIYSKLNPPPDNFVKRLYGWLKRYAGHYDPLLGDGWSLLQFAAGLSLNCLLYNILRCGKLDGGIDVNYVDAKGRNALAYAIGTRRYKGWETNATAVVALVDHGAEISKPSSPPTVNFLARAAAAGDLEAVRVLVECGADVNAFVLEVGELLSFPPLLGALVFPKAKSEAIVRFLIDNGAEVNQYIDNDQVRGWGTNALHQIIYSCRTGIVDCEELLRLFLDKGAKVNWAIEPDPCMTILQCAVEIKWELSVRILIEYGANVNLKARRSIDTPLRAAVESGNLSMTRLLLGAGATIPWPKGRYGTLFQVARRSEQDSEAKVRLLHEHMFGKRWIIKSGITIEKTAEQGSEAMLRILLRAHAFRFGGDQNRLLQLARRSETERDGKVRILLRYKYGHRWLNNDWKSASSTPVHSGDLFKDADE